MASIKKRIKSTPNKKRLRGPRRMSASVLPTLTQRKPRVILPDSEDYRKIPHVTPHVVEGQRMYDMFLDEEKVPRFPVERDFKTRAATRNMDTVLGKILWQDHIIGIIGTLCKDSGGYPAGTTFCLDGHTRRYVWENIHRGNTPDQMIIIEHVCDNYDDIVDQAEHQSLKDIYYHYNSNDSVEKSNEQIRAIIEDLKLVHPITGDTWVNGAIQSKACKRGDLKTVLNYVCYNQDGYVSKDGKLHVNEDCDYANSDTVGPKDDRSASVVKTDVFRSQLESRGKDLMMLDTLLGRVEELSVTTLKSPGVKSKVVTGGPEAKWVYDLIFRASLMIICKKYNHVWPQSIIDALDTHVNIHDGPEYILEKGGPNADYMYNINRAIRDAKKLPDGTTKSTSMVIDANSTNSLSQHRLNGWRDAKKAAVTRIAVMDTVWNLYCIAEQGVRAKQGGFDDVDALTDWYENVFLELRVL